MSTHIQHLAALQQEIAQAIDGHLATEFPFTFSFSTGKNESAVCVTEESLEYRYASEDGELNNGLFMRRTLSEKAGTVATGSLYEVVSMQALLQDDYGRIYIDWEGFGFNPNRTASVPPVRGIFSICPKGVLPDPEVVFAHKQDLRFAKALNEVIEQQQVVAPPKPYPETFSEKAKIAVTEKPLLLAQARADRVNDVTARYEWLKGVMQSDIPTACTVTKTQHAWHPYLEATTRF